MESIGQKIILARTRSKYTQKRLAIETGLDQHLISEFENDKKSPTVKQLEKIALCLQIEPEGLIIDKIDIENNTDSKFLNVLLDRIINLEIKIKSLFD